MSPKQKELFVLVESAAGFILIQAKEWDAVVAELHDVQTSLLNAARFGQVVSVKAVLPFLTAEEALENCEAIVSGESTPALRDFLKQNLPSKKKKYQLGVVDPALAKDLTSHDFSMVYDKNIFELTRLCRFHMKKLMKHFGSKEILKFQVGLGHNVSRSKLKMDPNRQDKPVQNAVALLENLDKGINMFAMRVKEWYGWHFPELAKIVTDNIKFAQVACLMRSKDDFDESRLPELVEILDGDDDMAREVLAARKVSMGQDIVEADMINIEAFGSQLVKLAEQRKNLATYLGHKLEAVAPNLQTLCGDVLAAKLIAHSGSLTNLAKYPASTVQILGAEKALFRALKTKSNTPKYGLLFQSSFIGRAAVKNKAARIDTFSAEPSNIFGTRMRDQVEARLEHLVSGAAMKGNAIVMQDAYDEYKQFLGN